jgi:fucose 4-O-acetylase-like acetyltransferase
VIELPWYPTAKQLRQFAFVAPFGFALIGYMVWRHTGSRDMWIALGGFGVLLAIAGSVRPGLVRPFYLVALAVAFPIGWLVSNLAFLAMYYLLLTPLALFFRLVGRDVLVLRRRRTDSHWIDRGRSSEPARYWRQG